MPEESNQSKFENYSLSFDGSNEQIQVDNDLFGGLEKFSVSFWYNMSTVSGDRAVIGRWSLADAQILIYHQGSTGYWRILFVNNSGTSQGITTTFAATLNTWQFISFIYDGSNVSVQLNNETIQSLGASGSVKVQSAAPGFQIGADNSSRDFTGQLDQVCIFDYALSTDQRNYLYNSGTPVNPMAISGNAPIAYYPLGGSSTGSASTLTIPNESVPSATVFNFDGSDDRISIPEFTFSGEFTLSMWINPVAENTASESFILGRWNGNFDNDIQLLNGNGASYIRFRLGGTALTFYGYTTNPDTNIDLNKWQNLVFTRDSSNLVKCFKNGVEFSTNQYTNTNTLTLDSIGRVINSGYGFEGKLSNIAFFDAEVSAVALYNNGVPLPTASVEPSSLKAWYKLNVDTSTWDGSDWIIGNSSANYTSALNFDGSDYINASATGINNTITVSAWINTSTTGIQTIVNEDQANSNRCWNLLLEPGNKIQIVIKNTDGTVNNKLRSTALEVQDGKWHHIAFTYDGTADADGLKTYVDGGNLESFQLSSTGISTTDTLGTFIGTLQGNSGWRFTGTISNISIFNTVLDAAAISTLFNSGTPQISISGSPISWWKLDNTTTGIQDSGSASNNATNNGTTVTDIQVSTLNGTSDGMTTANLVNSDLTRSIPYSSYSMVFDGINDYISFPADASLNISTANHSMSFWLKTTDSGICVVSQKAQDELATWIQSSKIKWAAENPFSSTSNINDGTWKHICFVADGSSSYIYINGVLDATGGSQIRSSASFSAFAIGSRPGSFPYEGSISSWALFNKALTEDQILTIYNVGVPNDISSLSPVSWWSLAGDSYFDGNNWICPDLGSANNNGTSSGMGGTELVGNGPGSTANGVATSMDIPANLKGNASNSSKNAFSINMNPADRVEDVPA